ncbi:HNH endonuclease [Micromonospora sp. URMC 107]|uniref:HNH endonuclease n=1 Tax=Micromonospora sp. URMC 107 TaxID=3423418 RepID=UPI003F1D4681
MQRDDESQFGRLLRGPYYEAVVVANRAYLQAAVPDAAATEREYWTLSCLPNTRSRPRRLSAVSMKTMETFVLHEPADVDDGGRPEGFVVVRRSILKRHWPSGRALGRAFPGLTEEPSDYEDAGEDQARVRGRYDELIAALTDERFASAVRDLVTPLLSVRTMQGAGHCHALVDHVLGRAAHPAAWVYPVNEESAPWGYPQGALETLRGFRDGDVAQWELASCFHKIRAGDRIWVYATTPHQRLAGAGMAWSDPYEIVNENGVDWRLDIRWDIPLTRFLLANVITSSNVLTKRVPTVRAMRPEEAARLADILSDHQAPQPASLPEGRRRRLAEVTARQGQADFRRRLILAYGGRCAITDCDVEVVLQAAHISPYDGPSTNRVTNGLLLRADLHNLFDRGYLWIDGHYRVRVAEGLDHYADLDGRPLRRVAAEARPDKRALADHRNERVRRVYR